MYYIEQIPRREGEPFYTTELDNIKAIQEWCLLNCDTSKRHVITKSRFGGVIAEGLVIPAFYGHNNYTNKPFKTTLNCTKNYKDGYKVFNTEDDALLYYLESKKEAMHTLDSHMAEVEATLVAFKGKGINFDAWATCSDDHGLDCGLGVSCTVNGFYFHKRVE